jgi:hypothetical protein
LIESINPTTNRLSVPDHGLTSTDKVFVTTDAVLATGIPSTICFAKVITSAQIELYEDFALTTLVDITDTGSGDHYLRYADGVPAQINSYASVQITDGNTHTITVSFVFPYGDDEV